MTKMLFPKKFNKSRSIIDFAPYEYPLFIPDDDSMGIKKGFYISINQFAELMRINKKRPEVIQFLADML